MNLHAGGRDEHGGPRDERLGFLNQSAMNSTASFGGQDDRGVGGRLPEMERVSRTSVSVMRLATMTDSRLHVSQYNPNQYSPQLAYQHPPPGGQPRYGDPYGGR